MKDIILFKENVGNSVKIKASGGIGSIEKMPKSLLASVLTGWVRAG